MEAGADSSLTTRLLGLGQGPHPTHQTRTFSPDLQAVLHHLTGDKPRQTTHLLPDPALVTKAMLPNGGGHGWRLWVPPEARGLQLVEWGECWWLGDSGPPGSRGGEVSTPL